MHSAEVVRMTLRGIEEAMETKIVSIAGSRLNTANDAAYSAPSFATGRTRMRLKLEHTYLPKLYQVGSPGGVRALPAMAAISCAKLF